MHAELEVNRADSFGCDRTGSHELFCLLLDFSDVLAVLMQNRTDGRGVGLREAGLSYPGRHERRTAGRCSG